MGFFKRFFSEVEDPTVELMLQKVSGVGIRLREGASTEDLFRLDWSREDIARRGHGLLLTIMGMSSSEEHSNGAGLSSDVWYFEEDCAEDPHPYVSIVNASAICPTARLPSTPCATMSTSNRRWLGSKWKRTAGRSASP
jgi:hypothetical protein